MSDATNLKPQMALLERISAAFQSADIQHGPQSQLFQWKHLQVLEKIGEGGFGDVFRAYDPVLRRDVALKLSRGPSAHVLERDSVLAEARSMARLRHPNILAVHGAGDDGGQLGIWSDLLNGQTLAAVLDAEGVIKPAALLSLAQPVTEALALIHGRGLIHGDIKPANIMVLSDGQPVLMDFGSAREALAAAAQAAGSPLLMAPEQFEGHTATPASDMYALGATLFRALTGRYPVNAANYEQLAERHAGRAQIGLSGVPLAWRALIQALLARNPDKRPTAEQAGHMLERLRTARRRRLRQVGITLVTGSLMVAVVAALLAARTEARHRQRTDQIKDVLVESIQSVNPLRTSGPVTVKQVYERLLELADERLTNDPAGQAAMLLSAGQGLSDFGDPQAGLAGAHRGLALLEAHPGAPAIDVSEAYLTLASIQNEAHDFEAAEKNARKALEFLANEQGAEADRQRLIAANRLYFALDGRGMVVEAVVAQRSLLEARIALYGADHVRTAVDHHNLASSLGVLGHWDEAFAYSRRALQVLESAGDGDSTRAGIVYAELGRNQIAAGQIEAGLLTIERARERFEASLDPGNPRLQVLQLFEARAQLQRGQVALAGAAIERFLALENLTDIQRVAARRDLATALMQAGDWRQALDNWRLALQAPPAFVQSEVPAYETMAHYCAFRSGDGVEHPRAAMQSALSQLESTGYGQTWSARQLRHWLIELDQLL